MSHLRVALIVRIPPTARREAKSADIQQIGGQHCFLSTDKLSGILEHGDASKFAEKLFDLMDGYKGSSKHSRSSRKRKAIAFV